MNAENLVKMANQIANFFHSEPDRGAAVAGVLNHMQKFWDPRMRRAIVEHTRSGASGLTDIAAAAVLQLK